MDEISQKERLEASFKRLGGYRRDTGTLVIKLDPAVGIALAAIADERARIVAWLRADSATRALAGMIERGDHHSPDPTAEGVEGG